MPPVLATVLRRGAAVVAGPLDGLRGWRGSGGRGVVVLVYHRVGARTPSPIDFPLATFTDQLDRLADSGRVIDLDSAVERLGGPCVPAGQPAIVITFDDGTADWPDVVLPELVARRLPATFYVSTDFVEAGRPFPDDGLPVTWSGLAELAATGLATIASHTHTHRVLADADAAETTAELDRSIGLIEDRLGVGCHHFAYPKAIAPSAAAEVVVRRRFATAALAGNRLNVPSATDLHRLGRHGLTVADGPDAFARKLGGGASLEGWLRERRERGPVLDRKPGPPALSIRWGPGDISAPRHSAPVAFATGREGQARLAVHGCCERLSVLGGPVSESPQAHRPIIRVRHRRP